MGRALHRHGPPPLVLDDRLAAGLAGEDGRAILDEVRETFSPTHLLAFQSWIAVRARFVEDVVHRAASGGIHQYVMLGAGLDSFAYRHPELSRVLQVFEVDHPLSQARKQQRLEELHLPLPDNAKFVAVDFERQSLREALEAAGFSFNQPAVVSWIGVSMYLVRDAIEATLNVAASGRPGTQLVLTYNPPPEVLSDSGRALLAALSGTAASLGEPWISLFRQEEIDQMLEQHRFGSITHFGAAEAMREYFRGKDRGMPGIQSLAVAILGERHGAE
ncbi:MAG: class I SAM-dependent methyltransferase [Chloroflexi bacterium]|nr:class I SAM-dependent methyltransferase [Chloroflexota bacterium]